MGRTQRSPSPESCRAAVQLGRSLSRALEASELTPAAYRLLAYLASGSSAATAIADNLAISRPTVTATTTWLEERSLVTREPSAEDGRRVVVTMTERGARALEEADRVVAERLEAVLSFLDDEIFEDVLAALENLFSALTEYRTNKHRRSAHREATA